MNTAASDTAYGKHLMHMRRGSDELHFLCDAGNEPVMVDFNGVKYHYLYDVQGNVVGLLDSAGNLVVEYKYTAWGEPLPVTGSLASTLGKLNPFRYKGYVYDEETGYYYLGSRYYRPEIQRFINADNPFLLLNTGGTLADKNLFAYRDNNPVSRRDAGGKFWLLDVILLGSSIIDVCRNPGDMRAWIGFAGDLVDLCPFVTGVGETARALKVLNKGTEFIEGAQETAQALKRADHVVDTYRNLRKTTKGTGLEVHHIVEKKFADALGLSRGQTDEMLSIALSKTDHRVYTNKWRQALPYGKAYTADEIWGVAMDISRDDPALLDAARKTLGMK